MISTLLPFPTLRILPKKSSRDLPADVPTLKSKKDVRVGIGYEEIDVNFRNWRLTDINQTYSVCDTYPRKFVVPSTLTDSQVWC